MGFINRLIDLTGDDFKKCMQCATCSVACDIAPNNKPYPRKEMLAASWGLKHMLVSNHDIWLCHQCGDCNTLCPRDVKPGDVLSAVRACAIDDYAGPGAIGKLINDPRRLALLLLFPALLFVAVGLATGLLDFTPGGERIVHSHFFSHWLVEIFFIPLMFYVIVMFVLGIKKFITDIHANALKAGKTAKTDLDLGGFMGALLHVIPDILLHRKFYKCNRNKPRAISHTMVFFSFLALAMVAGLFGFALHFLDAPGPYSQLNPVKWIANLAGVALVIGSLFMIKERLFNTDLKSTYGDWYFLGLVFGLGLTGILVELTRLADAAVFSYALYFIHLVFAFNLVAFMPFIKLAHLAYRTVAIAYDKYIERD